MLIALLFASASSMAAEWLTQLQDRFQTQQQRLGTDAHAVLAELLNEPVTDYSPPLIQAQYHLLLSQTYYILTYPHEALAQAQTGAKLVHPTQQPWLYHQLHLAQGLAYDGTGTPAKGLELVNAALEWAEQHHDLSLRLDGLFVRGALLTSLVDYPGAMQDLQNAHTLAPQPNSLVSLGQLAGAIALVYEYRHEPELSIPYFEEASIYHEQHQQWQELSISLYGLGRANIGSGNIAVGKAQLQRSAELAKQVGDIQGIAYAIKELAAVNIKDQKYALAEQQLLKAKEIFDQAQNPYMQLDVTKSLSALAIANKELEEAEQYLQAAREYLDPTSMPIQKISLDEQVARVEALKGNFQQAYQQLHKTVRAKQRIYSQQSTEQLHQLRSHYELESKEQNNQLLARQNELQKITLGAQQRQNIYLWAMFGFSLLICLLLAILVYRNQQNKKRLLHLANVDSLTGLLNRRKALEILSFQFDLAVRHHFQLCVVVVDLDFFKKINDQFGHAIGDKVLQRFGNVCQSIFRSTDIVGRIGGEEFIIALPHTQQSAAENLLHSLRKHTQNIASEFDNIDMEISISCGLSVYQEQKSIEELIAQADKALYQAKEHGRDRMEIFTANTQQRLLPV
ncbi:GGDEF domain-containing protein [Alteromonadaceae bacterium BrNp21-10]|nr:GGDEF domain-containing protein [Alteromonadaceae bacterium BrNp21-10]